MSIGQPQQLNTTFCMKIQIYAKLLVLQIYFIRRDGKKRNGVEVEIVKYSRSEAKNTLCIIEIDKVKIKAYNKYLDFPEKILNPPRAAIVFHV